MNYKLVFRDIIPESDLSAYGKGDFGLRAGYGKKPAIIVIDMTYAFVDPSHALASGDMGWNAVKSVKPLIEESRNKNIPIIYTIGLSEPSDTQAERGISRKSLLSKWVPKPRANDVVDEISPKNGDIVLKKRKASIFFGTNLLSILVFHNIDTLIMTGATTSGCVRASVVDAASNNFYVIVPEECVADRAVVPHKANLFDIDMKYGDVVPLQEVLTYVRSI